jgi:hypothetical protein
MNRPPRGGFLIWYSANKGKLMSTKLSVLAATAAVFLAVAPAAAQTGPMIGIEQIVVTLSAQPPGNVFEQFYPNAFDLVHPKKFTFEGVITNGSPQVPAFVDLWFDWIDPRDPIGTPPKTSPIFPIDVPPGGLVSIGLPGGPPAIMYTIPFCPPQVSIHIQNNGPGQPVVVEGRFIHECLIPEPATGTLLGIGLLGLASSMRRRRTRSRA